MRTWLWLVRAMPLDHCGGYGLLAFHPSKLVAIYQDEDSGNAVVILSAAGRWLVDRPAQELINCWHRGEIP